MDRSRLVLPPVNVGAEVGGKQREKRNGGDRGAFHLYRYTVRMMAIDPARRNAMGISTGASIPSLIVQ
jgi:hypothetical protein